jgi:hypothetical protein
VVTPSVAPTAAPVPGTPTAPGVVATTAKSGSTPAAAPTSAPAQSKTPALTNDDKILLAQGYKLEMRGGQKFFCHSETQLGTRFQNKVCHTAEALAASRQNSKDFASDMQRPGWNGSNGMSSGPGH